MKQSLYWKAILAVFFLFTSYPLWGYEVIKVTNGGKIKGEIKFAGEPPAAKALKITKDQDFCGKVPDETYVIGPNKGIKNVVVAVTNIGKGKAFDEKVTALIDNNRCRFVPHVQAVSKAQKIKVKNSDPVLHNTHPFLVQQPGERTIVNLALPNQGQVIDITKRLVGKLQNESEGIIRIKCDAHEWMLGWVHVHEHPYFAVTDEKGGFTIGDIPPGKYKLRAWHEALGRAEKEISVPASGEVTINFEFSRK